MPFRLGPLEVVLILVIIFIIFGAGKLPQVGEAIGKSWRAFRKEQGSDENKAKQHPQKTGAREDDRSEKGG